MDERKATTLRGHEVTTITADAGYESTLSRQTCYGKKLVQGRFECLEYAGGLSVHLSDLTELADVTSRAVLSPRVSFVVLLAGQLHFALNNKDIVLASTNFDIRSAAIVLESTTTLHRKLRAGARVTKVHVTATPKWLETYCGDMAPDVWNRSLDRGHQTPTWTASREMAAAAKAILAPSRRPASLQKLFVEHQAAVIVSEGVDALHQLHQRGSSDTRRTHQISAVQEYLDVHLAEPLNLAAVGHRFGMSISTLQRHFSSATGVTVGSYVRSKRLERARQQLRQGKTTVSEAAYQAGYNHPNNFITAYKNHFGHCPGNEAALSIGD